MNRDIRSWRFGALTLTVAIALVACSGTGTSSSSQTDKPTSQSPAAAQSKVVYDGPESKLPHAYADPTTGAVHNCKIGYMNIAPSQPSLQAEQDAAGAEAKRLGCVFIALDDQLTLTRQVDNFDQLLSQHVGAILVYPIVGKALAPSVAKAKAQGVYVVSQNTPVDGSQPLADGYSTNILQGFDTMAYDRANGIAQTNPGATFALLGLGVPVEALQYFQARTKYWCEKFGLRFVDSADAQADSAADAATAASGLLTRHPDLGAIFAYNDTAAVAASTVVRSSAQSKVKVVGNNGQQTAFNAVRAGQMYSTTLPDIAEIGTQSVRAAYNLLAGKKVPSQVVVNVHQIDSSTIGSFTPVG